MCQRIVFNDREHALPRVELLERRAAGPWPSHIASRSRRHLTAPDRARAPPAPAHPVQVLGQQRHHRIPAAADHPQPRSTRGRSSPGPGPARGRAHRPAPTSAARPRRRAHPCRRARRPAGRRYPTNPARPPRATGPARAAHPVALVLLAQPLEGRWRRLEGWPDSGRRPVAPSPSAGGSPPRRRARPSSRAGMRARVRCRAGLSRARGSTSTCQDQPITGFRPARPWRRTSWSRSMPRCSQCCSTSRTAVPMATGGDTVAAAQRSHRVRHRTPSIVSAVVTDRSGASTPHDSQRCPSGQREVS